MTLRDQLSLTNSKRCARLFAAVALLCVAASVEAQQPEARTPQLSSFELKDAHGKKYDFASLRGQIAMLSFGATWCKPCAWELAALEDLKREYQDRPVKFLWVSVETEREASDALLREYAKAQRLTIPVLRDPMRAAFAQFSQRLRVPMILFFDQQGAFVAPKHIGMSPQPDEYKTLVRRRLDALLAAETRANRATRTR